MQRTFPPIISAGVGLSLTLAVLVFAQQTPANAAQSAPDNTRVNKTDQLSADKTLSTYAHNVKVITANGEVTLKGPVRSEDERKVVEAKAIEVAGQGRVSNELTIAPA